MQIAEIYKLRVLGISELNFQVQVFLFFFMCACVCLGLSASGSRFVISVLWDNSVEVYFRECSRGSKGGRGG